MAFLLFDNENYYIYSAKPFVRMKTFCFAMTLFIMTILSCKKQIISPIDQLPPATQVGANTFGCLINGQAFIPKTKGLLAGGGGGAPIQSQYMLISANGTAFYITARRDMGNGSVDGVSISTDSLRISEGKTLLLTKSSTPGLAAGFYGINLASYKTNSNVIGQLTITHLDTIKQIVSATFHFNAVSKRGDTVKITNGRFDVHYSN